MIMQIVNALTFVTMLLVNALANMGRLGGFTTAEISYKYNNLLTPAGWTFSIWGVIYALLLVFIVASFFNASAKRITGVLGNLFWVSCVLNILWLVTWHYNSIILSMIMMLGLFGTLIVMNTRLVGTRNIFSAAFSTYVGWITVAMLANFTVMMVSLGMDGTGSTSQIWTTAVLPFAALAIAVTVFFTGNWVYGLTAMIAYLGIVYRQISSAGLASKYSGVLVSSIVGLLLIGIVTFMVIFRRRGVSKYGIQSSQV